ncbi:hypothetical protein AOLI_G00122760 [Acnodon oligacanthus]
MPACLTIHLAHVGRHLEVLLVPQGKRFVLSEALVEPTDMPVYKAKSLCFTFTSTLPDSSVIMKEEQRLGSAKFNKKDTRGAIR